MKFIDLRSDTVTKPSGEMLEFMLKAEVGDDVLGEDPTVRELEKLAACITEKEDALFCPSGTMANQIAIKVWTSSPGEMIVHEYSHVLLYEGGGPAFHSGLTAKTIKGGNGLFDDTAVESLINPDDIHFPPTQLIVVENSCNKGGGSVWPIENVKKIKDLSEKHGLKVHLDGARLFNACIAAGYSARDFCSYVDSVSICLSKGLGAPLGSVLCGNEQFIKSSRRIRKLFGGGMRQAGYMAACGIFALQNNIDRLEQDHKHAYELAETLQELKLADEIKSVQTNIILYRPSVESSIWINLLEKFSIGYTRMGEWFRWVTHLNITVEDIQDLKNRLNSIKNEISQKNFA